MTGTIAVDAIFPRPLSADCAGFISVSWGRLFGMTHPAVGARGHGLSLAWVRITRDHLHRALIGIFAPLFSLLRVHSVQVH